MNELNYTVDNNEIRNVLHAIAYRNADYEYIHEYYGGDYKNFEFVHLIEENKKTMRGLFEDADKLRIPFWVQNRALAYGEDWRRYKGRGPSPATYFKGYNINGLYW